MGLYPEWFEFAWGLVAMAFCMSHRTLCLVCVVAPVKGTGARCCHSQIRVRQTAPVEERACSPEQSPINSRNNAVRRRPMRVGLVVPNADVAAHGV